MHPFILGRYNLVWGHASETLDRVGYLHENHEPDLSLTSMSIRVNGEANVRVGEWVVRIVNVFYILENVSLYKINTFYSTICNLQNIQSI